MKVGKKKPLLIQPEMAGQGKAFTEIDSRGGVDRPVGDARRGAAAQTGLAGAVGRADRIDRDQVFT